MEKDFVPYEPALELKELGFDEPCFAFYNGKFIDFKIWDDNGKTYSQINPNMDVGKCVSAPTFSQAFRWFREKYNLYSIIFYHTDNRIVFEHPHYFRIYEMKYKGKQIEHSKEYKTYQEAELECLKKLIEIVKK